MELHEVYRDRLVAYSLGNQIFDQDWSDQTSQGLLLEIGFISKKPVYFNPKYVTISKTQAHFPQQKLVEYQNNQPRIVA